MNPLDKLTSTDNPNVIIMALGVVVAWLDIYVFNLGLPPWLYISLAVIAGLVFLGGFAGLVRTQNLKDKKSEQEIELLKEKIKTEKHKRIFNHKKLL